MRQEVEEKPAGGATASKRASGVGAASSAEQPSIEQLLEEDDDCTASDSAGPVQDNSGGVRGQFYSAGVPKAGPAPAASLGMQWGVDTATDEDDDEMLDGNPMFAPNPFGGHQLVNPMMMAGLDTMPMMVRVPRRCVWQCVGA